MLDECVNWKAAFILSMTLDKIVFVFLDLNQGLGLLSENIIYMIGFVACHFTIQYKSSEGEK